MKPVFFFRVRPSSTSSRRPQGFSLENGRDRKLQEVGPSCYQDKLYAIFKVNSGLELTISCPQLSPTVSALRYLRGARGVGEVGARWELGRGRGGGGESRKKASHSFLSLLLFHRNCCASPARVRINNNGRFRTSQKLTDLRKNVVPQPPLIKSALLLAKKLSRSFDQILIYPARDTIHILVCFALAGGRSGVKSRPQNYLPGKSCTCLLLFDTFYHARLSYEVSQGPCR